ncbi:hypothetical protein EJ04DRAFT_127023 [Polyplosphaeria fusca]|uniref:Uncharacterized protein n=1 Tax=Polyplosphaeria fusca TaxID=682080 RepID=A0A9P4QMW3_9PLEO|nr:hypothetical protein EJ04DRAFT_127023 [Polyplosphaeria fusca]
MSLRPHYSTLFPFFVPPILPIFLISIHYATVDSASKKRAAVQIVMPNIIDSALHRLAPTLLLTPIDA